MGTTSVEGGLLNPCAMERVRDGIVPLLDNWRSLLQHRGDLYRTLLDVFSIRYLYQYRFPQTVRAIVLAAGRGRRMGACIPKVLQSGQVGRPLVLRVLDVLAAFDANPIVVVNPLTGDLVAKTIAADGRHDVEYVVQEQQLGMGHAIMVTESILRGFSGDLLIAWGDMGALNERIIFDSGLVHEVVCSPVTFPTKLKEQPRAAITRDSQNKVCGVLQSKEGECVPQIGESDCGVFWARSPMIFGWLHQLQRNICDGAPGYASNSEFNFLPILRLLAEVGANATGLCIAEPSDSQGVNTPADIATADRCFAAIKAIQRQLVENATDVPGLLDVITVSTLDDELSQAIVERMRMLNTDVTAISRSLSPLKARMFKYHLGRSISAGSGAIH